MYTLKIKDARGQDVRVHHNPDWSGMARVDYHDDERGFSHVDIPAALLLQIGHEAAHANLRSELIRTLEFLEPPWRNLTRR